MINLCYYGCGQIGKHQLKNGRWCCNSVHQKCPANKRKYSNPGSKNPMFGKNAWNKGLTKENNDTMKEISNKLKEGHKNGLIIPTRSTWWKGKKHTDETKNKIRIDEQNVLVNYVHILVETV